jgi:gliding motility-associated lipoprotein GldB
MRKFIFIFILFFSCESSLKKEVDVSATAVDFSLFRFDQDFYTVNKYTLQELKEKYPLFFPESTPDSIWVHKIKNKEEQELFAETQKIYASIAPIKNQLTQLFKHIKYYNPTFVAPDVYTLLSNIDYENRVLYANGKLTISLDAYLGKNHSFYSDYPKYIRLNNEKTHIVIDVAKAVIKRQFPISNHSSFIAKIIDEGKKMYLLDRYLPRVSDQEKIGYPIDKFTWALENEAQVWKYFISNELLFSSETKLNKRFIDNAPFSKFYSTEDNASPGRIGVWIGWQIVRSYMDHNEISLTELLKTAPQELFKKSKYKPKK